VESGKVGGKTFIQKIILRSLAQASYSSSNIGHFGLGLKFYSHFTSPIRRYPDLIIHRIITEIENGKWKVERGLHYKKLLPEVAKKCSEMERIAEKLEYKVRDYFVAEFYKDKV
jgi:ribonuclease R